jgi:hypothetical protein
VRTVHTTTTINRQSSGAGCSDAFNDLYGP